LFPKDILESFISRNSLGIMLGLVAGKFLGIFLTSYVAVKLRLASISPEIKWNHLLGVSFLGGIGFTMSIFIANLAFTDSAIITASKMSILLASLCSALIGLFILKRKN
jgi:NhaA family Na+:H+ antiporter